MEYLFSEAGSRRLDEFIRPGMLCMFDFDGTLAPIVKHPDDALLPPDIRAQLLMVAARAPVGIITGRGVDDVRSRIGFRPHFVVGNHGVEGLPGRDAADSGYERLCHNWSVVLRDALADRSRFDPNIFLEEKRFSLSVHYRIEGDREQAARRLRELFDTLTPRPRVIGGKCIFNLVPAGAPDKGRALEELVSITAAPAAIYVGDDVTDEDVFRLRRNDILSVRVGRDEASAAEFFLHRRAEVARLLDVLIDRLEPEGRLDSADASA